PLVAKPARPRRRAVLALVVHGDVRIEDPLLHPAPPVLQRLAVRPRQGPVAAVALRTVPVRDGVGADAEIWLDGVGLDVDLANDVGDLISPPLLLLWIVRLWPISRVGYGHAWFQLD